MITLHTIYVVTLVSQATTTMVLFLLAWSDRRIRGLTQLALACGIHTVAIALQPLWRGKGLWLPEAVALTILPLLFFFVHTGLRSFFGEPAHRPGLQTTLLGAVMVIVFILAPFHQLWPFQMRIAESAACVLLFATIRALWRAGSGPVRIHAQITAGLLLLILSAFLARLVLEATYPASAFMLLVREVTMVAITLLAFSFLALYLAESGNRLHKETRLDSLTGLPNRRAMEERAAGLVGAAQRTGTPLALLMMDLDAFKLLNDTWGHAVGDRALRAVGDVLLAADQDKGNTVARLGGEEFAMLLPRHSPVEAQAFGEHLRSAIAGVVVLEGSRRVSLTVSIGVAAWQPGEPSWSEMLRRADAALYRAKREGRNRVVLCTKAVTYAGKATHVHPAMAEPKDAVEVMNRGL